VARWGTQRVAVLGALLVSTGCQLTPGRSDNLLVNPGFEAGREGWSWRDQSPQWGDFAIVEGPVRGGRFAAQLKLRQSSADEPRRTRVYGVVQEIPADAVPEAVGGWYRVDRWEKSDPGASLYLQLVAIVWGDPRTPEIVSPQRPPRKLRNYQLRYYLAGAEQPAFRLGNGRIVFVSSEQPALGEWTHFEVRLTEDLQRYWQTLPRDHDHIELLFEARWDGLEPGESIAADVGFDDLYAR